ncbi:MAG: hypothetical protein GNW80_05900 [Asgard group archaeon]|nr:hypothetical protein [Asgard group archaeon]
MSLIRIIIGGIIGSLVSAGAAIGLIYGGLQVAWWLALILAVLGCAIGGFVAGFIAQDKFPGMLAGGFTGLIVFVGIVLFFYFVLRAKVQAWWDASLDINTTIASLLDFLSIDSASSLGQLLDAKITDIYNTYDINTVITNYLPKLSLLFGAIIGGAALILDTITGRIGGRLNKIDELSDN